VATEKKCLDIKKKLDKCVAFSKMAKAHSTCPSGKKGGALGKFKPGQMVKEFDKVVFSAPIGVVQGPIKTEFGYHLVEVTNRVD
jgi:peptidyl-prolyl cis-trans isomerase C